MITLIRFNRLNIKKTLFFVFNHSIKLHVQTSIKTSLLQGTHLYQKAISFVAIKGVIVFIKPNF
jgi:hypothetical protein